MRKLLLLFLLVPALTFGQKAITAPEQYGSELITDGQFNTACAVNWICGDDWVIAGGVATHTGASTFKYLRSAILSITANSTYILEYEVTAYTSGALLISSSSFGTSTAISGALGSHTVRITSSINSAALIFGAGASGFVGSLDNVSLKKVTKEAGDILIYNGKVIILATNVIADGNSLTVGTGGGGSTYPAILASINSTLSVINKGVNSQTTPMMEADASTDIDPLFLSGSRNILIAWEVTNDIYFGATNQEAYDNIKQYCQNRQSAGWDVIVAGVIPRGQKKADGTSIIDYNLDLDTVNSMIDTSYTDFADVYVALASDPRLSDYSNTTYYSIDSIHLNATGYSVVADLVNEAIISIQGYSFSTGLLILSLLVYRRNRKNLK